MEQHQDIGTKLKVYEVVAQHYRNDFSLYWQRTNFFLLVSAGLFGFSLSSTQEGPAHWGGLKVVAALAGLFVSLVWYGVARSSIEWIDVWRRQFVRIDEDINPYRTFVDGENASKKNEYLHQYFRPEVISTLLPIGFAVAWAWLLVAKLAP